MDEFQEVLRHCNIKYLFVYLCICFAWIKLLNKDSTSPNFTENVAMNENCTMEKKLCFIMNMMENIINGKIVSYLYILHVFIVYEYKYFFFTFHEKIM